MFAAAMMWTSLVVAVPAHADAGSDFLARVSGVGLNVGDTSADVQLTLATGSVVCQMISDGYTPRVAGRQVKYRFPGVTQQQVSGFVDAAQATLCVSKATPLEPGGY
ncbi:MAG: hypothetical protein QOI30_3411 [Mycobacterium sp.]|jgi:ferric-dicitrate binding protein FerR (iron transport regulator)|nr:hypothetical protein [Mycobacterium sp.]